MTILDQEAPGLSGQLGSLSVEQWRSVIAKVCQSVSPSITELEPSFQSLLKSAVDNNSLSPEQIAEVRAYADLTDDRYLTSKDEGVAEPIWRNWFAKARLATALADAFSSTSSDKAADAAYELCFVEEDKSGVINLIRSQTDAIKRAAL